MFVVCVKVQVIPERTGDFIEATRDNARGTRTEPKNVRFDVLQANDDPSRFFLYEVYQDEAGLQEHQRTAHYLAWKERVAPMMAAPRSGERYSSVVPDPWE